MREPVGRTATETNVGRSNHRTAEEQAILVCKREWASRLDKGYKPKDAEGILLYERVIREKNAQNGNNHGVMNRTKSETTKDRSEKNTSDHVEVAILPMLAHKYLEKRDKYVDFDTGVYIQPKLDGVRCIARLQKNVFSAEGFDIVLTSRNSKQFVFLSHIKDAVKKLLLQPNYNNIVLDGELYMSPSSNVDGIDRFNTVSACCRTVRNTPHEKEMYIEYHVFDLVDLNREFDQETRFRILDDVKKNTRSPYIKYVPYYESHDENDVQKYHTRFIHEGYEGVIVRAVPCLYTKYRSSQLLKYKQFDDREFPIIGASKGEGDEDGCVVWICQTDDGTQFSCRPRGTLEHRKKLYNDYTMYMGSMLTVRFQELTATGVPRFPVGITIRNYE